MMRMHRPAERPLAAERACLAALIALAVAGCAQRGDFGRQEPNIINDAFLPVVGYASTWSAGEEVSAFNYTDDELTLRDLGWSLVVPTHAEDWLGRTAAELQRTEIVRRLDLIASPSRYHDLLASRAYRSSDARYARIMDDAAKDMAAIEPYMAYAARVRIADDQRLRAAQALPDIGIGEMRATHGRIAENQRQMAWVKRAMLFRLYAYRYAVDRLMIETPSRDAGLAIRRLDALEAAIQGALAVELERGALAGHPGEAIDLMDIVTKA